MHRIIKKIFTLLLFCTVLAIAYAVYLRDLLPNTWHRALDPAAFGFISVFALWIGIWVFIHHFRYRDLSMEKVDSMDGFEFERFCAFVLKNNGYRHVNVTQESGDQGVDIIASRNKKKYGIQCKRYNGLVGNHAVQEVWSGCDYYDLDEAIVLSNSEFSDSAQELATELGVQLINRDGLRRLMKHLPS